MIRARGWFVVFGRFQVRGVLRNENGRLTPETAGVTFHSYKAQQVGAPLRIAEGPARQTERYSMMLGSSSSYGLPSNTSVAGKARWLAVQVEGQPEQPRVMLLSVPDALKAEDAGALGDSHPPLSCWPQRPTRTLRQGRRIAIRR